MAKRIRFAYQADAKNCTNRPILSSPGAPPRNCAVSYIFSPNRGKLRGNPALYDASASALRVWHKTCVATPPVGRKQLYLIKRRNHRMEEIMTPSEVAALLKIHLKTVYKLAEKGVIPGNRIGRSWRFSRSDVLELVSTKPMSLSDNDEPSMRVAVGAAK
jgi:excisionase family DNA binding protein